MEHITKKELEWLKIEINHILDSGANDIRLTNMVDAFLRYREREKSIIVSEGIKNMLTSKNYQEIKDKIDNDLLYMGISAYKTTNQGIEYVDPLSPEAQDLLMVETSPNFPKWGFRKEFINLQIKKVEGSSVKYFMGVTKENDKPICYCLMRHVENKPENIILIKESKKGDLQEEIENLAKYFDATIITETK